MSRKLATRWRPSSLATPEFSAWTRTLPVSIVKSLSICQYKYNYSLYVSICVNVKVFFEVAWWASIGFTGYQDLQRNIYRIDYRGCFSQCFRLKWGWNPKHMKHAALGSLGSLGSLGKEKNHGPKSILIHWSTFHPPPRTSPDRRPKKRAGPSTATGPHHQGHPSPDCNAPACRWNPQVIHGNSPAKKMVDVILLNG